MKKTLAIVLALVMILGVIACTPKSATQTPAETKTETKTETTETKPAAASSELAGEYTITVWAAEKVVDLTKKQIEDFNKSNELGITFKATVEAVGEGDAATKMITDVEAGGDIYFFAQDQFNRLVQAGALGALGAKAAEFVQTNNVEAAVTAATTGEAFYAYPVTADNTFFVFYDKSVVKEESLGNIASMIADCEAAGKTFCFDLKNGWYLPAYFFGVGCKSTWEADSDGKFLAVVDNFNSDKGFIAAKALNAAMSSDKFVSTSETSEFDNNAGFVVSGTWNTENAKSILGDNFGAAPLPKFTVDGTDYQLSPFTGSKLIGVKPHSDAKLNAACHQLAQYLTGEQAQVERFEAAGWGPSKIAAAKNEKVLADAVLGSIAQQAAYSVYQGNIPGNWWGNSAQVLGEALQKATNDDELKAALAAYEESLGDYLKKEGEEELPDTWGVIGSICGTSWNEDFLMTEKEAGVWVSEPLEFKAGEEFKVRLNKDWTTNYGENCEANGANIKVPADDTYTVTLDLNNMTLTFVNQEGVLPEAAPVEEAEGEPAADTWAVIGSLCGTNWDTDLPMTEKDGVWTSDKLELKAGDEFKVRANAGWDKNYGITEGATVAGGDNIKVEADGTYVVTLDLTDPEAPALSFAEPAPDVWAVIGGICGTSWDTDFAMTEVEPGVWKSEALELKAGEEFKVRANADWGVNMGVDADGVAVQDGPNVKVEADGTYVVTLNLNENTLVYAAE
ncbi:MAG: extracellular solute-binding protein [Clostridia bacterium]|nr:extracellular solute-binding protein [Clostridia bacterium]